MVLLQRKLYFSKDPEGVHHVPGGGANFFQGGAQILISIETHITCDFQGAGVRTPYPPLNQHIVLVHVPPRNLVLYIQGTRLCSTR